MRIIMVLLAATIISACNPSEATTENENGNDELRYITTAALKKSDFPLSTAVEANGWVFLSGALGTTPGKGFVERGIEPETRQTMENIKATLASEGLTMDRVVKCSVMLADMKEWPAFNAIYKEYFDANYPARSAFGVNGLAANARVEIECIARR